MSLKSLLLSSVLAAGQAALAQAPATPQAPAAPPATPSAPAGKLAPDVQALVDRMQRFYESTNDFTADFEQAYTSRTFRRKQTSSGKVTFKKPGMLRWEYAQPSPRTFVLAGSRAYTYEPEARTLTVTDLDTSQLSASVTFLLGKGRLQDEFSIRREECKGCKGVLLVLDPLRPDPRFRQVRFEVDPKTAQVLRSIVVEADGSENAITFLGLKPNVGVDKAAFKLTPPPDTRVVDLTQKNKK